jgi:hypothetical protein
LTVGSIARGKEEKEGRHGRKNAIRCKKIGRIRPTVFIDGSLFVLVKQ